MKAVWYPIDMRLTISDVNKILDENVTANKLLVSSDYGAHLEKFKHV